MVMADDLLQRDGASGVVQLLLLCCGWLNAKVYPLTSPRELMGGTSFRLFLLLIIIVFFFGLAPIFKLYLKARLRANYGPRKEPIKGFSELGS